MASFHNGLLITLTFLPCFSLQPVVMQLVGGAGLLLLGWRLAVLVTIGIPVAACFDRPKESGKGPKSESSWEYLSQSWLQISLFHFLYRGWKNCGPLSVMHSSGMTWREKFLFMDGDGDGWCIYLRLKFDIVTTMVHKHKVITAI